MEAGSAHTHGAHGRLLANCHSSCRPAHLDPVGEQASAGHAAEGHEDGMVCLQPGYPAQQQPGGNGEEGSEGRNARYRPGWHVVGAERVRVAPDLMVGGCRRDGGAVRCGVAGSRLGPRKQYCSAARALTKRPQARDTSGMAPCSRSNTHRLHPPHSYTSRVCMAASFQTTPEGLSALPGRHTRSSGAGQWLPCWAACRCGPGGSRDPWPPEPGARAMRLQASSCGCRAGK